MNDSDNFETVPGVSALNARPPNGARVVRSLRLVGAARRPTLVRADTASFARGWRPTPRDEALRASSLVGGAAQLAPRWNPRRCIECSALVTPSKS